MKCLKLKQKIKEENLADRINDLHDEISRNNDRIRILEGELHESEFFEDYVYGDNDGLEAENRKTSISKW